MAKYKGWIPTVSGRLSFSVIGRTNNPTRAISQNVADHITRYIIVYQKRPLIDASLPLKTIIARRLLHLEGNIWCLCVAKSSNDAVRSDDSLKGRLYLFHGKSMWRGLAEDTVRNGQNQLGTYRDSLEQSDIIAFYESEYNRLQNALISTSSFYVDFKLQRTGEATITTPDDLSGLSVNAPHFPDDDASQHEYMMHIVCSQMFFFLRDISHEHQHHNPRTDTIVDIYKVDDDDYSWRSSTLRVLLRKVLQYKRERGHDILNSSLGILAYANSFRLISGKTLEHNNDKEYLKNDSVINPTVNNEPLEQSIRAAYETMHQEMSKHIRNAEWFRNAFFGTLGSVLMLTGLLKISNTHVEAQAHPYLVYLANMFIENPLVGILIVAVIIFAIMVSLGAIDVMQWRVVRGIMRIIHVYPRKISVLILIFLSLACGILAIFVIK